MGGVKGLLSNDIMDECIIYRFARKPAIKEIEDWAELCEWASRTVSVDPEELELMVEYCVKCVVRLTIRYRLPKDTSRYLGDKSWAGAKIQRTKLA